MHKINLDILKHYLNDITRLIKHFTETNQRTIEVMENLRRFIENESAIVAGHIINDELVSLIWCYERNFSGTRRLHISYFIVDENYRGRGLSKDLLHFCQEEATKLNIQFIDLNVDPENETAIKVYKNSGFITEKLQLVMEVNKDDKDV